MTDCEATIMGLYRADVDITPITDYIHEDIASVEVTQLPFNVHQLAHEDNQIQVICSNNSVVSIPFKQSVNSALKSSNICPNNIKAFVQLNWLPTTGKVSILVHLQYKLNWSLLEDYITKSFKYRKPTDLLAVAGYLNISLKGVYNV